MEIKVTGLETLSDDVRKYILLSLIKNHDKGTFVFTLSRLNIPRRTVIAKYFWDFSGVKDVIAARIENSVTEIINQIAERRTEAIDALDNLYRSRPVEDFIEFYMVNIGTPLSCWVSDLNNKFDLKIEINLHIKLGDEDPNGENEEGQGTDETREDAENESEG